MNFATQECIFSTFSAFSVAIFPYVVVVATVIVVSVAAFIVTIETHES